MWEPDVSGVRMGSRELFDTLEARAYLNHAAVSPASSEVRRAVAACVDDYARLGLGAVLPWIEQRNRLRARLGGLIGAEPDRLAFVGGTTRAVFSIAMCIPWNRGDRVVCLHGEFPTNVTPWQRAAETFGLELAYLNADDFRDERGFERLDTLLARGVRLIACSAVQFQSGLRMPLASIVERAHAQGAEVFIDVIQAAGIVPLDLTALDVDYAGGGAHKWLMGLEGAGYVYVGAGRTLVPRLSGWLSHVDALRFLFDGPGELRYDRPLKPAPAFLESGSMSTQAFAALEAAIAPIESLGVDNIFAHVSRYCDVLETGLEQRGFTSERCPEPGYRSGILSVVPPSPLSPASLVRDLGERGIAVTGPDGRLRFAPHWPNALDEIGAIIGAIDELLRAQRDKKV